ncbi:phosphate ABC transporter permease PstA [Aquibaculum arenosum]|uniref:Phosphate transport system permease protein PstA n=1 Tax=Aquibaculum arenosum TaxID=3032591 RepID=A0ABT5YLF0_9PROT|nr:phosphate ABC transporter permease PstA [Fodinicurvata sp. CAU 1616]MDF2095697.1 phosphate ABC transporter permease PstA [Fodinicurvata sp. CAU 1616]
MTDSLQITGAGTSLHTTPAAQRRLRRRYAAERRFKALGLFAVLFGLAMLAFLLTTIVSQGYRAFIQTHVSLEVYLDPEVIDPRGTADPRDLARADYQSLAENALYGLFPAVEASAERRALRGMLSQGAGLELRRRIQNDPELVGTTLELQLLVSGSVDQLNKGVFDLESGRRLPVSDEQIGWFRELEAQDRISAPFNWGLFTRADSREPELAGLAGALQGSLYLMIVTFVLSFPLGIGAAIYLEEFAPKNRLTDLIEVNINNLAAVPSIVFGLLGLAVFIQVFGLPRSAPLVGGMVLALMTLPTIIIATRASLKAVPPSIREAALGIGASRIQTIFHHVLPLAMPGILTGAIIGLAQALGETAPLLMVGMNAFVTSVGDSMTSPATALPTQVYMWADSPQRGFVERTSAAIMVLLGFLIVMNALAVFLRRRFERRW